MKPITACAGGLKVMCLGLAAWAITQAGAAESIHPDSVTPEARFSDAPGWELGTVFRPSVPGKVTHARVFSLAEESGEHQATLWRNSDGSIVGGPYPWSFGGEEAWITLDIPDVAVQAGVEYTLSISVTSDGWYPANPLHFASAGNNGQHLAYPAGAGVFSDAAGARPVNSFNNSTYLRDVVFEPDTGAPIMTVKGRDITIAAGDQDPRLDDHTQFGGVYLGQAPAEHTFSIANTGGSDFALTGSPKVALSGANPGDFAVTAEPGARVAAGGSTTFTIRFQPGAPGVREAVVALANSAGAPYEFTIQGIGMSSGRLTLGSRSEGASTAVIDAGWIRGSRHQALRNMRISAIRAKVLGIEGTFKAAVYSDNDGDAARFMRGTADLANPSTGWHGLALTEPLDLVAGSFYWLVLWSDAPGARVYADPSGVARWGQSEGGSWPDPVSLGAGTGAWTYSLFAEGVPLDVTGPEMGIQGNGNPIDDGAVAPAVLNGTEFGAASVQGVTRELVFTIQNVGQAALELTGNPRVAVSGPQASDFTVTTQPGASVAAGATASFTVRFDPSSAGVRQATLTVARGDNPANPYDFLVQGLGLGGGAGVLGNDSEGTFARNIDDGQIHGNRFLSPRNMRISELRAKVLDLAGTFKCAVYSDRQGAADRLLAGSVEVLNATNGWNSFPLTAPLEVKAGEFYWLVIWSDTVGARVQGDQVSTAYYGAYSYFELGGQWPDPIALTQSSLLLDPPSRTYCIYGEGVPIGTVPGPELDLRGKGKLIAAGDVTPSLLDGTEFGSVDIQSGRQDSVFTIENTGDMPLELTGNAPVQIHGADPGDFLVVSQPTSPVPPGGAASLTVRFDPTARGFRAAVVSIASNDADESPYEFSVQGAGLLTGRESIWPDTKVGRDVDFDGTYYELGMIFQASVPGKITHLRVFSLASEAGDHTARLWRNDDETVVGGPYTWNYGGTTGWILFDIPDVEIEAGVDYTVAISTGTSPRRNYPNLPDLATAGSNGQHLSYPVDAGVFTETRGARPTQSFNHGDYLRDIVFVPAGITVDLPVLEVRGNNTIIAAGDLSPTLTDHTDFGEAAAGTGAVERSFTLANTGTAPLRLTGTPLVAIGGSHSNEFVIVNQPAVSVAAGASATFTIRFTPAGQGPRSAVVSIRNDSDQGLFEFAVAGQGLAVAAPLTIIEVKSDPATLGLTLRWEGPGQQFQVERSATVTGPYQPVGPPQSGRSFTDGGVLQTAARMFYRVRQL